VRAGVMRLTDADFHVHITARMAQRGITRDDVERAINEGWDATDAKPGVLGKVIVLPFNATWENRFYAEKEVSVYFKQVENRIILLTAKARYGKGFPRKDS